jgi:HSP20 family protein
MNALITTPNNGRKLSRNRNLTTIPEMANWINELFDNTFEGDLMPNFNKGITLPAVNIKETTNEYVLELAATGMKKSDFNIEVDHKLLSISSELSETKETEETNYTRREFGYSSFKRSFNLPETVDATKVSASYNDGILMVNLPKREEAIPKPPQRIEIK